MRTFVDSNFNVRWSNHFTSRVLLIPKIGTNFVSHILASPSKIDTFPRSLQNWSEKFLTSFFRKKNYPEKKDSLIFSQKLPGKKLFCLLSIRFFNFLAKNCPREIFYFLVVFSQKIARKKFDFCSLSENCPSKNLSSGFSQKIAQIKFLTLFFRKKLPK